MQPDLSNDQYFQKLQSSVFPSHWKNPTPAPLYDLVVIGGGPGGMTAATIAAGHNAKVALVEKEHLGGECLNMGCIPSKALLRASKLVGEVKNAAEMGIEIPSYKINFSKVMERVRRLQSTLGPHDSPNHFTKLGIDVFLGTGRFLDSETLEVAGQKLRFKRAIIATGTQPVKLPLPGLEQIGYLTNQNVFKLTSLPPRLAVIGAGPIGCELAQAFARFGSKVTLITRGAKILPRDDQEAANLLKNVMIHDGVQMMFNTEAQRIEKQGHEKVLFLNTMEKGLIVDEILIAIGRVPTVSGMNLEKAGVIYDHKSGIASNDTLQTSNPKIYAIGDVTSPYKFTHISKELAKMAVLNALAQGSYKRSSLAIPWCTYTDPEIAHISIQDPQSIKTTFKKTELKEIDRALLDGETTGFVKIHVKDGTDQIVEATIMAKHAGEMISEVAVAIASNKGASAIAQAIHCFPTQAEAIRSAANAVVNATLKSDASHKRAAS